MLTFQVFFLFHPKQSMSIDIKLYIKYNRVRISLQILWINGHLEKLLINKNHHKPVLIFLLETSFSFLSRIIQLSSNI